ncbi:MAG TPA: oligogalacturonate lyase family protein [Candidatus Latescibacteria bacterium]|nr:oligogalacturonate lyase family protein [Candidatus Latescibacterota bacterium]HQE62142.1 oligogalacturonate lyase family protein [Candidatus Latescibacterota bacterium]HQI77291.1 oligogalacturonate lyase family protein [Candidatus Latescibacterota bacterium]
MEIDSRLIGVYRSVGGAIQAASAYSMERIPRTDPLTGVRILQLTSYPVLSHTLYYHCPSITPDSKTLVFMTYNRAGRFSTPDAWRVNLDGTEIRPVTNREGLAGFVISPDGKTVYCQQGGTLLAAPMENSPTGNIAYEVASIPDVVIGATLLGSITADGKWYISTAFLTDGSTALVRYATDGSEARVLKVAEYLVHVQVDQSDAGRILYVAPPDEKGRAMWVTDCDGGNPRTLNLRHSTGHFVWFGKTGRLLSTVNDPFGSIVSIAEGEDEPQLIAKGGHFWHAAGSQDGKWVVSDTNWPDIGLILINTETGLWAPLCKAEASEGHPQWTHPHPMFTPDGRHIVFNSDRTGIGQIYTVEIPESLRQQLSG